MYTRNRCPVSVRTDLAMEERNRFRRGGNDLPGLEVREWENRKRMVRLTEVKIITEKAAKVMGKPEGTYLTMEVPFLMKGGEEEQKRAGEELAERIRDLAFERRAEKSSPIRILVAGLGNPDATPDSLGPLVVHSIRMTRHLALLNGEDYLVKRELPSVSGIAPGVMGDTGMETAEIIIGIVKETKPDLVIAVDALTARSVHRLGNTIQLTDTGITPGSGVGNHRNALTEQVLGIPVIAIGVPTVAGTETVLSGKKKKQGSGPLYVTPYNIDERVRTMAAVIAEALDKAFFV